jgi:arsenate reductase (thioredoxin)
MAAPESQPLRVLFLCTHNSARSQIAEALLQRKSKGKFVVASAGTEPASRVPLLRFHCEINRCELP